MSWALRITFSIINEMLFWLFLQPADSKKYAELILAATHRKWRKENRSHAIRRQRQTSSLILCSFIKLWVSFLYNILCDLYSFRFYHLPVFNCSNSELSLTNAMNISITHKLLHERKVVDELGPLVHSIEVRANMATISIESAVPRSISRIYTYNKIPIETAETTR